MCLRLHERRILMFAVVVVVVVIVVCGWVFMVFEVSGAVLSLDIIFSIRTKTECTLYTYKRYPLAYLGPDFELVVVFVVAVVVFFIRCRASNHPTTHQKSIQFYIVCFVKLLFFFFSVCFLALSWNKNQTQCRLLLLVVLLFETECNVNVDVSKNNNNNTDKNATKMEK